MMYESSFVNIFLGALLTVTAAYFVDRTSGKKAVHSRIVMLAYFQTKEVRARHFFVQALNHVLQPLRNHHDRICFWRVCFVSFGLSALVELATILNTMSKGYAVLSYEAGWKGVVLTFAVFTGLMGYASITPLCFSVSRLDLIAGGANLSWRETLFALGKCIFGCVFILVSMFPLLLFVDQTFSILSTGTLRGSLNSFLFEGFFLLSFVSLFPLYFSLMTCAFSALAKMALPSGFFHTRVFVAFPIVCVYCIIFSMRIFSELVIRVVRQF